ncbi:cytochrome P450 [Mycena maculata]|uniref:Cytochrome P450 n=1 Tax=Mycena maculata TaxID=230809 RepID=A0AAD7JCG3_9AGAR|nr:cytochrome P450 [Mycena maculata]
MVHSPTLVDAAFAALVVFLLKRILVRRKSPLPPGPRPWLGVFALPSGTDREWCTYGKWAEKWGDITSITVFGQPVIVLNSLEAATQVLEKKSSIYSDRPTFQMCGELVGWKRGMALLAYGTPQFRRYRKYFHQLFGSHANFSKFHPIEVDEYRKFLQRLLESPESFLSHIHLTSSAVVLRITYGYTVQSEHDPIVDLVNNAMAEFSECITPGAFLVDLLPILKYVPSWMPGAGFQRKAKVWADHVSQMLEEPFELVEKNLAQGSAQDSFVSVLLQQGLTAEEISDVKWSAGSIYGGGADTTVSAISTFFLQMALHPEIQVKAQAELDAVVGNHRLPVFEDREHLPFVNALCKEVLRYHPIGPMGLPHRAMEDDIHNGYLIPKGSLVLANIWNMMHNPEVYANPMAFDPSRFIASDGHAAEPDPDVVFGLGRRVCPGKLFGDASVFMACAMTLSTFTISKKVENGVTIEPVEDYQPGTISQPAPFVCSIKPRSSEAIALIS